MEIIGLVKNSFVDYPGKITAVFFSAGCNMNCWYCHNRSIIKETKGKYAERDLISFLESRKSFLDAVVISGGEPTLQGDLKEFIKKVRQVGLNVKLDTNGTNPKLLSELLNENLLEYVAMDIKQCLDKYESIVQMKADISKIRESISVLMHSEVPYEFRTTFAKGITVTDIRNIAREIHGARSYYIQKYTFEDGGFDVHKKLVYHNALLAAREYVPNTFLRGF